GKVRQVVSVAVLPPLVREIEHHLRGALRRVGGSQRVGVRDQGVQGVRDILIGSDDRGLILRRGLQQRLVGGALGVQQRAAGEYRLRDIADQVPERAPGA